MKKEGGQSARRPVKYVRYVIVILFLFFTFHFSLSSLYAEEIRSRAALVMEASSGRVLYGKNPNLRLPPASTTKLMTAMVALDRLDVDDVVTISEKAALIAPIKVNFRAGEKATVKTLLYAALIKSANDAAYALAEAAAGSEEKFTELMNQKVLSLGMSDTQFTNSTGLPGSGQYTTVHDLSRMMRHALRYPLLREIINTRATSVTTEGGRSIFLRNINRLLWEDETVLGGKTGYTREARHCFICAGTQDNETVIVAVLGAPSRELLWRESEELLRKGHAIRSSQEEPVIYFTRSDYNGSLRKASYGSGYSGVKKAVYRKAGKEGKKAKAKVKAKSKVKGKAKAKAGARDRVINQKTVRNDDVG